MLKGFVLLWIVLCNVPCSWALALQVRDVKCTQINSQSQRCEISLQGKVSSTDSLYIEEVADIDILSFGEQVLGSTGYLYGKEFYARFIPRIYPLSALTEVNDPVLTLEAKSVAGDSVGLGSSTQVKIVPSELSLGIYVSHLLKYALILIGIVGLIVVGVVSNQLRKGISGTGSGFYLCFVFSSMFVVLSMSKIPRVLFPSLITPSLFYKWHVFAHSCALLALSFVVLILYGPMLIIRRSSVNSFRLWTTAVLTTFTWQIFLLLFFQEKSIKFIHQFGTGPQIVVLALMIVLLTWAVFRQGSLRTLIASEKLLLLDLFIGSGVMVYDGLYYIFSHNPSTQYYFYVVFVATIVCDFIFVYQKLWIEKQASLVARKVRKTMEDLSTGRQMLAEICNVLLRKFDGARVSIISIRERYTLVLSSAGDEALTDGEPQLIGKVLSCLVSTKSSIIVSDPNEFGERFGDSELNNVCLMAPVIQEGIVIAAISLVAKRGQKVSPELLRLLDKTTEMLSLEALSAINKTISENQINQLKLITSSTSGLVLEYVDPWGKIRDPEPCRRVIISIDGVKSTYIDQIGNSSNVIWQVYRSYKQEIYSSWMALREVFELVSSDVRGDDFWVLSPLEFENQFLASLGPEKVALIAAFHMEKISREISGKPEYSMLQRSGFHASVSADVIEILPLGIRSSILRDIFAKNMSMIHRIRGEAIPGSVLVDISDERIRDAIEDASLFRTRSVENIFERENVFPDLHKLPKLVSLIEVKDSPDVQMLLRRANQLVLDSPYIESA